MADLFASGRIVDLILALVAVEAVLLLAVRRVLGRGPAPALLLANLAAGAALMLALRAGLTQAAWPVVAGWLLAALMAHVTEMVLCLRRGRLVADEAQAEQEQRRKPMRSREAENVERL